MKLHIITIGKPRLDFAVLGWKEYLKRLRHYHDVRVTHIADKYAADAKKIVETAGPSYTIVLEVTGQQLSSPKLAEFLEKRKLESREVTFIIGGPDGLPEEIQSQANFVLSLSSLTLPHDLAMVVLAESLYRASTISAGHPYHK